jgi:hypothetical protein
VYQNINALHEAGVERIHFWLIGDYEEQIEIFRKEIIVPYFQKDTLLLE